MKKRIAKVFVDVMAQAVFVGAAEASCGAAFCPLNTNWNVQGVWTEPGARFDLRYEYIDQDQPRHGRDRVRVGEIPRHHDEIRTINRNWLATLDYSFSDTWGASVTVPLIDRDHAHIHNHRGARLLEQWDFTEFGDVRLLGRYTFRNESIQASSPSHAVAFGSQSGIPSSPAYYGIHFGLKLPTGRFTVENDEGQRAERSLQPGSGTTDLLLGGFYTQPLPTLSSLWFVQALGQVPLNARDEYRPGKQLHLDVGYRYNLTDRLGLLVQLNTLIRGRDHGEEAEPEDTGGEFVFLSPGVAFAITPAVQLYAFVQQTIYQHVEGVQLTADWAAVVGFSSRF